MILTNSILFYVLLSLGIAGLFSLVLLFRARMLHQQKIKLKAQVKKQTEALENTIVLLRDKQKELEDNNHIKNKLIAVLSHDISTPLQFISLVSEHLQQFPDDTAEMQSGLQQIHESSEQLISMADDLLSWMKAQDMSFQLAHDEICLKDMIAKKLAFFSPLAESESIYVKNQVAAGTICHSDQRLLGIIIHNIISNAVKFTTNGGVIISSCDTSAAIILEVADTGIGMNEEKLAQVQQAIESTYENGPSKITGKGIGLMLIHDLAGILGVKIIYSSKKGVGTTVAVYVPKAGAAK
ncbi:MAG TPA: HAMP domain-containing sensor histidine kinase [Chitinophagaceae bacterium]|jgi:signal transduction histidine kinase|nr:HAMP domain-containing sensor histidine kinase [Chitinophagaceae bacterium]